MTKILIVDSHPIVLKGIASMLTNNGYVIFEAATPEEAIMIHKQISDIDLMVCDLSLPTTADGIELIECVRNITPQSHILVFTMHGEPWNMKALMDLEVDGVVMKGERPKELMLAIYSVINGEKYFSPQFRKMRNEVMVSSVILSNREIKIIREIAFGRKNREIAEKYNMCEKTIEYYRSSILRKLGVKTIVEAVRCACEIGLLY